MSNGFASALEISAKIIRDNLSDSAAARRLIAERLHTVEENPSEDNDYVLTMREGFGAVLGGMYAIAKRGER